MTLHSKKGFRTRASGVGALCDGSAKRVHRPQVSNLRLRELPCSDSSTNRLEAFLCAGTRAGTKEAARSGVRRMRTRLRLIENFWCVSAVYTLGQEPGCKPETQIQGLTRALGQEPRPGGNPWKKNAKTYPCPLNSFAFMRKKRTQASKRKGIYGMLAVA